MENAGAWWAWERLHEMIEHDRQLAWRMVQVMVAYAPDQGLLASVAAGPVEDLFGLKQLMRQEAEINPRFRICLGMTNGLPEELEPFADRETRLEAVPTMNTSEATPEEIALMVAWFHHSDTSWAPMLLDELNRGRPDDALFVLRLLLASGDEYPHLREKVFLEVFNTFVQLNFAMYRDELKALARQHDDLRRWCLDMKRGPADDSESWATFLHDLRGT